MEITSSLERYSPDMLRVRQHLHQYPELSLRKYKTSVHLQGELKKNGIPEQADIPYRSKVPGVMRACGNDCHTAMVLGARLVLNNLCSCLPGKVKLLFQEGEAGGKGAINALKSYALDDCNNSRGIHLLPDRDTGFL